MTRRDRPDADLVAAARGGDRRAFAVLAERHYGLLLATCRRATADRELAADAAQEAVVTALVGLERLRDPERFGAWLIGIGLNLCRRALQERARWARSDAADTPAPGPGPQEAAEAAQIAQRVRAAIAALPAGQRAAVALFHLGGLSHAEVAGRLGTRPGAVKTRLHKARGSLRHELVDVHREELAMPTAVPMSVADVRRPADRPERHIVVLEEVGGERRLPIWIGMPEALSLVAALEEVELPRPGPYHFAQALLSAAGGALREVRVSRLADQVFYAVAVLADGTEVDARPSDALTLALVTGVPIAVEPAVLDAAERLARERPGLAAEASAPGDGATVLADEVRARLAGLARELAELSEPPAGPGSAS
jgi:RNA polymerase sigma factor (sigma-70 family)